jgi:hypothetical protein
VTPSRRPVVPDRRPTYSGYVNSDRDLNEFTFSLAYAAKLINDGEYNRYWWGLTWEGPGVVNVDIKGIYTWPPCDRASGRFDTSWPSDKQWRQRDFQKLSAYFFGRIMSIERLKITQVGTPVYAIKAVKFRFSRPGGLWEERWAFHVYVNTRSYRNVFEFCGVRNECVYVGCLPLDFIEKMLKSRTSRTRYNDRRNNLSYCRALDYPLRPWDRVANAPVRWQLLEPEEVNRAKSMPALVGNVVPEDDCATQ